MSGKGNIEFDRRNWLKAAGLGGMAAIFPGALAGAETQPAAARKVRGVVFMVSDGMSPGVLTLAEAYSKLKRQQGTKWWSILNEKSSARGLMDTASASSLVTDSAAASTAWGAGQRVNNGTINFDPSGKELTSIAAILKKTGARVGLVSTATITHATPAGFAAAVMDRDDEDLIASQYLDRVDILLGGGSQFFDPAIRKDQKNLFGAFAAAGFGVVKSRDEMLASKDAKLLGTFSHGHMPYSIDRDHDPEIAKRVPTLAEMSRTALARLLEGDKGFLLQIEGARIDHAAHANDIAGLLGDQLAFDDALAVVTSMIANRDDILVVATSDHGNSNPGLNGMGMNYAQSTPSFEKILNAKASHERLFLEWRKTTTPDSATLQALVSELLGFTLKAAENNALLDGLARRPVAEWSDQLDNAEGLLGQFSGNHTGIGWTGTTHTSDPTILSAIGPQSDRFCGMVKNSDVFGHLVEMLG